MKENWLFIKTPDDYGTPELIQFENNKINYFTAEGSDQVSSFKIVNRNAVREFIEYKFINPNRVRFFEKGKIYSVLSDEESITEDCIFENDYEKLTPTITDLTEVEIEKLNFALNWNGEKINVSFNKILDSPAIQEINERLNRKGNRILLQKIEETFCLSLYSDTYVDKLIPIKYVDRKKIILYGFPTEPYEVDCLISN